MTMVIRHQFWVGSQSLKFQLSYKVDLHSQETSVVSIEILNMYGITSVMSNILMASLTHCLCHLSIDNCLFSGIC